MSDGSPQMNLVERHVQAAKPLIEEVLWVTSRELNTWQPILTHTQIAVSRYTLTPTSLAAEGVPVTQITEDQRHAFCVRVRLTTIERRPAHQVDPINLMMLGHIVTIRHPTGALICQHRAIHGSPFQPVLEYIQMVKEPNGNLISQVLPPSEYETNIAWATTQGAVIASTPDALQYFRSHHHSLFN